VLLHIQDFWFSTTTVVQVHMKEFTELSSVQN